MSYWEEKHEPEVKVSHTPTEAQFEKAYWKAVVEDEEEDDDFDDDDLDDYDYEDDDDFDDDEDEDDE